MFGNRGGIDRALHPQHRRAVGGCRDDNRACQAFMAEDVLDELLDLATPLADQSDHGHVGCGVSRHHAEQNALAHA